MADQRKRRALSLRLILAQSLDVATLLIFYAWIGPGQHSEQNPLVLALMALGGIQMVGLAKIGVAAWIVWRREHQPTVARWWSKPITSRRFLWVETVAISVATASGVVGAGFNTASIVNATTGFAIHLG